MDDSLLCPYVTYLKCAPVCPAASAPGVGIAARVMAVPIYCISLLQPHATLFYWMAHMTSHTALQMYCASREKAGETLGGKDTDKCKPFKAYNACSSMGNLCCLPVARTNCAARSLCCLRPVLPILPCAHCAAVVCLTWAVFLSRDEGKNLFGV